SRDWSSDVCSSDLDQFGAERFDAGRMPQVEAENFQAMAPVGEVGLLRVALRGVAWEAGGHDQRAARAQQLQSGLVADLHPSAGEQRDAPGQVGSLGALAEVELRARRAELVVEVVDLGVILLGDVAV